MKAYKCKRDILQGALHIFAHFWHSVICCGFSLNFELASCVLLMDGVQVSTSIQSWESRLPNVEHRHTNSRFIGPMITK